MKENERKKTAKVFQQIFRFLPFSIIKFAYLSFIIGKIYHSLIVRVGKQPYA